MKVIRGHDADDEPYEVTIHAADVTILGKQKQSSRVFAVLAEELDEREVFFTWDDDSQEVERRISEQRQILEDGGEPDLEEVRQLAEDLAQLELDTEEWNNVRRLLFRLERDTYARHAGLPDPEPEVQEVQERDPEEAEQVVHDPSDPTSARASRAARQPRQRAHVPSRPARYARPQRLPVPSPELSCNPSPCPPIAVAPTSSGCAPRPSTSW
jgi:hypothetical protein